MERASRGEKTECSEVGAEEWGKAVEVQETVAEVFSSPCVKKFFCTSYAALMELILDASAVLRDSADSSERSRHTDRVQVAVENMLVCVSCHSERFCPEPITKPRAQRREPRSAESERIVGWFGAKRRAVTPKMRKQRGTNTAGAQQPRSSHCILPGAAGGMA